MTPEGRVKAHLRKRINALGGHIRFVKWIGRRDAPDCFVMLPLRRCWVETKAKAANGQLSVGQAREINLMRSMGEEVLVLNTIEAIDEAFPL